MGGEGERGEERERWGRKGDIGLREREGRYRVRAG